jgi:nucleoside-diphosphate-sugar epimerase
VAAFVAAVDAGLVQAARARVEALIADTERFGVDITAPALSDDLDALDATAAALDEAIRAGRLDAARERHGALAQAAAAWGVSDPGLPDDPDAAEALMGMTIAVARASLPRPRKDEWYVADLIGCKVIVDGEVVGDRPGKDAAYLLDSAKCRTELGWSDTVSLEDGIDGVIDWARRLEAELRQQPMNYIHKP